MRSVTTKPTASVSLHSAPPNSQRGDRPSGDAFGTLVDASMQGSDITVAQPGNSRDPLNARPSVTGPNRVMREPAGNSRASSAPPPQSNPVEAGRDIRQSSLSAEQSGAESRPGPKYDDPEIAPAGNAFDSPQEVSDTADPSASPETMATPPAVVVPVTTPVMVAPAGSTAEPIPDAVGGPLAQQTRAMATSPANAGIDPTLAMDTEAVAAAVLQETPDTGQAVRTVMQTEGALAAAVATEIQPEPDMPAVPAQPAAGGDPVPSHDATLSDHKHDAAESAKKAASETGTFSTQTETSAPHPTRALDAAATQPQSGQVESLGINGVPAQPQIPSNATVAATPQYNVAVATGPAVPLNGLAVQIAVTALSGKSRFEIRLDPADLGRIDVRLDVDRQGRVTSHLTVEKPETLAMLRQDAPHLQRALQDAGLRTGDGGLQFSLRDQSSQEHTARDGAGRHNHHLVVTEEDIPVAAAGRDYGRILGSNRGLDIRV
ncbi:flagellar hook-length control protein FliK [Nitrobacter winogradskyi]|nr:flagellar hook-length control protein FliK [Nitrobacter winogradskyi]